MREEEGEEGGLAVDQNSSDLEESLTSRVGPDSVRYCIEGGELSVRRH
jgi:hypothetical protein